jgi:LacI family transcriptional regulator
MSDEGGRASMNKRLTMRDIARELGVSISAVSLAFNSPNEISAELRDRVLKIANEHGYRPDPRARALRGGSSTLIALVVSSLSSHYFGPLASAVQSTISRQGYHLVVLSSDGTKTGERESMETIRNERMAGAIVDLYRLKPAEAMRLAASPIVLLADQQESSDAPTVRVDNFRGGYDATMHLVKRGCRRIAHITGPPAAPNASRRRAGYRQALLDSGLGPPLEEEANFLPEGGARAMTALLARHELPDGVFVANDDMALSALSMLRRQHIAVPESIAVVGFDNVAESAHSVPALTTVDQPTAQIGLAAATLLLTAVQEPSFQGSVDVKCAIVTRESA